MFILFERLETLVAGLSDQSCFKLDFWMMMCNYGEKTFCLVLLLQCLVAGWKTYGMIFSWRDSLFLECYS